MAHKDRRSWKPWQAKEPDEDFIPITKSISTLQLLRSLGSYRNQLTQGLNEVR